MPTATTNLLLASLSNENREALNSRSVAVTLPVRTTLYEAGKVPRYVYLMTSGIASIVTTMREGGTAEVGIVGHEGMVGGLQLLGPGVGATDCFVQMPATGIRIPFAAMQEAFDESEEIRGRVLEFVQAQTLSLAQIAACNRLHEAEPRLARWLLMVQDRVQSDLLELTQEFLAQMLGSQRTTVTLAAGILQRSGLIEYSRGQVRVVDRQALEAAACDCYGVTRRLFQGLYHGGGEGRAIAPGDRVSGNDHNH